MYTVKVLSQQVLFGCEICTHLYIEISCSTINKDPYQARRAGFSSHCLF